MAEDMESPAVEAHETPKGVGSPTSDFEDDDEYEDEEYLPIPHQNIFIAMLVFCSVLIVAFMIRRMALVWDNQPTGYGFQNSRSRGEGIGTIMISAVISTVVAFYSKYLLKDWISKVCYTEAAMEHGVKDDDEFLHLCAMSFVNIAVFTAVGPIEFAISLFFLCAGDDGNRVNPPSLQDSNFWVVASEAGIYNSEIFIGYILFEVVVWFLGWEKFSAVSFIHHGGFLAMGIMMRYFEILVFVGASAVAMELSSPALVIHMCARQLEGWDEVSETAFSVFAPLFVMCRLVFYTTALVLLLIIYSTNFGLIAPRLIEVGWVHPLVWMSVGGGLLQWAWSPQLFQKVKRKHKKKKRKKKESVVMDSEAPVQESEPPADGGKPSDVLTV